MERHRHGHRLHLGCSEAWLTIILCVHMLVAPEIWLCFQDSVAERQRRWTRNPLGSVRRGSNPLGVACCILHELGSSLLEAPSSLMESLPAMALAFNTSRKPAEVGPAAPTPRHCVRVVKEMD